MTKSKTLTIKALKKLRAEDGKTVLVGQTTEVLESTAKVLVSNKQAQIITEG